MKDWFAIFTKLHIFVYRITKGLLGSQLGKQSILLLITTGRRTGKRYVTTLAYYRDDSRYLIVGSNWGKEKHADWYYNLTGQPRTTIQVRGQKITVEARAAQGEEYQRLWQRVTAQNEQYIRYQQHISRRIPIVILTPISKA
jgi:deazaflavin-dependent oxidoreductase (nitroreductase family)